jgi:hypothetical protein
MLVNTAAEFLGSRLRSDRDWRKGHLLGSILGSTQKEGRKED